MKKYLNITLIVVALIVTFFCTKGVINAFDFNSDNSTLTKVKVTKIVSDEKEYFGSEDDRTFIEMVKFNAKYISGYNKSEIEEFYCFQTIYSTDSTAAQKVSVGDTVFVEKNSTNVNLTADYTFKDFSRTTTLAVLFIIFALLCVVICVLTRSKSTVMFIFSVIISTELGLIAFAGNKNILLFTLLSVVVLIAVNTISQFGLTAKTIISAVGSVVTLIVTFIIFTVIYGGLHFTGASNPFVSGITETQVKNGTNISFKFLLLYIIVVSAVGCVIFISNSVTSALYKNLKYAEKFSGKSGAFNLFFSNFNQVVKHLDRLLLLMIPSIVAVYLSNVVASKQLTYSFTLFFNNESFAVAAVTLMLVLICVILAAPVTSAIGTLAVKFVKPFKKF